MSNTDLITIDVDGRGIATITLNRPQKLNAMYPEMAGALIAALDDLESDPDVLSLIITGAGRAFCAGADLALGSAVFSPQPNDAEPSLSHRDWGGQLVLRLFSLNKPVIAAINGPAVGIGATMILPCDIRLASRDSQFGYVFARRGIVTDGCASWFLPRIVGIGTALKWTMTGALITAQEALDARLVDSIHDSDELLPAARLIAIAISEATSALSVSLIRRLMWRGLVEDHPMYSHRLESTLIDITSNGDDAREGVESFIDKRPPHFASRVPNDLPEGWPYWREPLFEDDGSEHL